MIPIKVLFDLTIEADKTVPLTLPRLLMVWGEKDPDGCLEEVLNIPG